MKKEKNEILPNPVKEIGEFYSRLLEKGIVKTGLSGATKEYPYSYVKGGRSSGKEYKERLMEEFQRGRECERRSIVARLKNHFIIGDLTCDVTLEEICDFILEGDK